MTKWQELVISDAAGDAVGTLGDTVASCPANLGTAVIENGRIMTWPGYMLSAQGAVPNWDMPCDVDWTGFQDAFSAARKA